MVEGSAINDILQMRQQGLSNNQIIQNLQREGYSNTQIFDAMNQADTKMAVEGMHQVMTMPDEQIFQSSPAVQSQEVFTQPPMETNFVDETAQMSQMPQVSQMPQQSFYNEIKVEELVEAVIEEKWEELMRDINKIIEWKNKVESRVSEMEIKLDNLKDGYSDLQRAILGKINEYDKHIMEVGSEIKAMEKVFSKVLPVFTENVNELSNITRRIKGDD